MAMPRSSHTAAVDGRRMRGYRTRRRLVEAYLALVESGDAHPSASAVADRAGVSLRTIYHHFGGLADLAIVALHSGRDRRLAQIVEVDPTDPLQRRIRALTASRGELFDRASRLVGETFVDGRAAGGPETARGARSVLRRQIEATFAPELGGRAHVSEDMLDLIDVITSADAWVYLRSELGRTRQEATAVIEHALVGLLAPRYGGAGSARAGSA
jgi:AcrR family transcriptional regulator